MPAVLRGALRAFRKWTAFHCAVLLSIVFCRFFREFSADAPAPRPIEPLAPKTGRKSRLLSRKKHLPFAPKAAFPTAAFALLVSRSHCRWFRVPAVAPPASHHCLELPAFVRPCPRCTPIAPPALGVPCFCAPSLGAAAVAPPASRFPARRDFFRAPHPKFFFSVFSFPRTLRRRPKESPCRKKRRAT